MEFLQLRYFDVIARCENISRAAEELHVSQPSLSGSLLRLEKELGFPLFDRRGRRLHLNDQGRLFWEKTRQILQLLADCRLTGAAGAGSGRIAIAFQNHNETLFRQICRFQQRWPDIQLHLYQSVMNEAFSISSFDFILSTSRHSFPVPMACLPLSGRGWYAVIPASSPLAALPEISVPALQHESFCFLRDNQGNWEDSYRICLSQNFLPRSMVTTNSPFYKHQILGEGILCGFIPTGWYDSCSQNPRIRVLPLRGFSNEAEIGLYWKKDEPLSPAAQLFLQFLREEGKKTENSL